MLALGSLVFAAPWVLTALAILPIIYWLLRVTPPAPRRLAFPAIRLLRELIAREETPERMPWWLLLLRLVLAALVILALAQPLLNPSAALPGSGPVILVVDDGWAAARDWPARQRAMEQVIDRAEREGREMVLATTARAPDGDLPSVSGLLRPAEARGIADALAPLPWPTDRAALLPALDAVPAPAHAVWLSDGLDDGVVDGGDTAALALARRLQAFGSAEVLVPGPAAAARLVRPPDAQGAVLEARVLRAGPAGAEEPPAFVRLTAADGRLLGREEARFAPGDDSAAAAFDIPVELRNDAVRLDIENEPTAGAVVLLDDRWRRRPVGIVGVEEASLSQPLLSDTYYLGRALAPYSEVRRGTIGALLDGGVAMLALTDGASASPEERARIEDWIEAGGVLLRFAGPILAANPDELVPVPLRFGDRILSGALSWTEPMPLAPFEPASPYAGLPIPADVLIDRQVLAEPTLDLAEKTWARLTDGTPLVTADRRGKGWLVLVHTTAGPDWSNLAISGLFVEMLRRTVALSEGVAGPQAGEPLPPLATLDGFGRLSDPPASAIAIPAGGFAEAVAGPEHPPGFYGTEDQRRALNLGASVTLLAPLGALPQGVGRLPYGEAAEVDLGPWLLALALSLVIADLVVTLALRGLLTLPRRRAAAAAGAIAVVAAVGWSGDAGAQTDDAFATEAANQTWLGYVITGIPSVDEVSRAGLEGLSAILTLRTAAETAGAMAVDVAVDELAFFPLLYWPIVQGQPPLDDETKARLNAYLRGGGTILFDTRDQAFGAGRLGSGPGAERLRTLTEGLDIPPLTPVPPDHVLTKAFYLMQEFPGRYEGGELWVENAEEHVNDGVSSVIIGANDWASAWAVDASGRPMFPTVPGGERQREMAFRFGVNLVMYALTGNYKADQVHVPAILERLGQ
jgi:hypothetical protein